MSEFSVRDVVKQKYGEAALRVIQQNQGGECCSGFGTCGNSLTQAEDPITGNLYTDEEASEIPEAALLASLGCGNPTALAALKEGEIVLDLGSGGGIDVLLSAKRVGSTGFAYGLDMTDEMLELANKNKLESGIENVDFLKGHIEEIPLDDSTVDVIISNCVINLSGDKDRVIEEAFRVLKPGGRFAVSDVVLEVPLPEAVLKDMEMYVGCVAGALHRTEYIEKLENAGFQEIDIEVTRRYYFSDLENSWASEAISGLSDAERAELDGKIVGAFIRAVKPA
jgi:arsenite methyltransferase